MIISDFLHPKDRVIEDKVSGHVFKAGDARALADLILWHAREPEKAFAVGKRGRRTIESRYSAQKVFRSYLEVFRAVKRPDAEKRGGVDG
jgi:glycosyltransferase involved in cell wall biosynthesis